jgi:hypothetical protein
MPLEKDIDLGCDSKTIKEFENLADKYYGK